MADATNEVRELWLYDDGSWREGFHDDGKVSPLLHFIATPADDAVARARERDAMERVIREAASVGLGIADRNSDAFNAALQRMGEALVALAAERDAKGGGDGRA